ncbi:MAG: PD-(D/E)XK nuclease family protein [Gammaproteobacteria bacterium]|nr:PD-(D/E)XK nuclease family protein [Gammaproteobacteria bacterium]
MAYDLDGIQYPSVTTITGMLDKPALLGWAARCSVEFIQENIDIVKDPVDVHAGEDILEQAKKAYCVKRDSAATSGTKCHKAIELYIANDTGMTFEVEAMLGDDDKARTGFEAFLEWESVNHVKWLETECKVTSVLYGYAGRFDAIAEVNGVRYLIDFKTSSGVYDEMSYQLCAYRQAYNEQLEEGQEPIEKLAILHLDKLTGEPTFKPIIKNVLRYTELFNTLVRAYYLMKDRRLKNNPFVQSCKDIGKPIDIDNKQEAVF